jgi:hypothetical protein
MPCHGQETAKNEAGSQGIVEVGFARLFGGLARSRTGCSIPAGNRRASQTNFFCSSIFASEGRSRWRGSDAVHDRSEYPVLFKTTASPEKITSFDLDDSKSRALVLETGYRYITTPGAPPENRMETIATSHFPLKAGFLVSDMNRADLDWKNGSFTWRYENKLTVERAFSIRSYHLIPYIAAEPYY